MLHGIAAVACVGSGSRVHRCSFLLVERCDEGRRLNAVDDIAPESERKNKTERDMLTRNVHIFHLRYKRNVCDFRHTFQAL